MSRTDMSDFLFDDADLIYLFVGGRHSSPSSPGQVDLAPASEELRERILEIPPDRFSEAVKFLRRMNLVYLLPNGTCGCGSTKFDIVATDDDPFPDL